MGFAPLCHCERSEAISRPNLKYRQEIATVGRYASSLAMTLREILQPLRGLRMTNPIRRAAALSPS